MHTLTHLVLMSRAPVAGQTKTRLIPALGAEGARAFHVACLRDVLDACALWQDVVVAQGQPRPVLHLAITPAGSEQAFRAAGLTWPAGTRVRPQRGATLEERMEQALEEARGGSAADRVLLIGCDLPLLQARHLHQAAQALEHAPLVLGPAEDGGYYLIGLGAGAPAQGLLGGTPAAAVPPLLTVERNAWALGWRAARIDALPDADTPEDLVTILNHPLARELAPRHSVRWLREHLPPHLLPEVLPA